MPNALLALCASHALDCRAEIPRHGIFRTTAAIRSSAHVPESLTGRVLPSRVPARHCLAENSDFDDKIIFFGQVTKAAGEAYANATRTKETKCIHQAANKAENE